MFKVLTKGCEPTRGSKYSACVDLYAAEDVVIGAGETKLIGLGVAIDNNALTKEIDDICESEYPIKGDLSFSEFQDYFRKTHYLQLMLRSSLGKKGLILPNGVGIIDLDYKDEIKMIIHNPIKLVDYDAKENTMYQYGCSHLTEFPMMQEYHIKKGDKIAHITLLEHKSYLFGIDTDKERDGGFGSTGR